MADSADTTTAAVAANPPVVPTWRGRPIPVTRSAIEDEIDRLVDLLDHVDGDPDLEPSLADTHDDDREGGDVLDEGEQSLGWTLATKQDGRKWLAHDWFGLDREQEHDGREPDADFEAVNEDGDTGEQDSSESITGGGSGRL